MSGQQASTRLAEQQELADEIASKQLSAILEIIGKLLSENVLIPDLGELRPQIRESLATIDAAADTILSEVEKLQASDADETAVQARISACSMAIVEACSFHDLCSQRLNKIDKTIDRFITGIEAVRDFVDGDVAGTGSLGFTDPPPTKDKKDDPEAGLLNGPALDGEGIDQDEVDRLLDFD